jgi:TrmH family RNA methyltransferase
MKRVSSAENPTFRQLQRLAGSARERRIRGRTLLDGAHLVQTYIERVGQPETLVVSDLGMTREEVRALVARGQSTVLLLADRLFEEASPVDTPSGLMAVIRTPPPPEPRLGGGDCVVLDGIQDPGNVGSILRSAAACGVGAVLLTTGCAQAWSPRVLRAGMGAHFRLRIHERAAPDEMLKDYSGRVIATAGAGSPSLFEVALSGDVAWLFGAEGAGLSDRVAALAHQSVSIPMAGGVESLNVAAAAAVCLFEQARRRGVRPNRSRHNRASRPSKPG